jgi:hypothetical protein
MFVGASNRRPSWIALITDISIKPKPLYGEAQQSDSA